MADWLARVASIRQAVPLKGGDRAPHKPLLILTALATWQRTGSTVVDYRGFEAGFARVLEEFAPPTATPRPEYPFIYLANDGIWETEHVELPASGVPSGASLVRSGARGRLTPDFERALASEPGLAASIAAYLLASNFPDSLHADVCAAVGLDLDALEVDVAKAAPAIQRDPRFRGNVLEAYEQRCAMCGFGGLLDGRAIGVEAAHVRWHSSGGPDVVSNGLALCTLHHKMFDRGVLGISEDHRVVVSAKFAPRSESDEAFIVSLNGRELLGPQSRTQRPAVPHVRWHQEQVFRSPPRPAA